ncbi:MAG: hypothetical protein KGZ56_06295 [Dethiobacter sp.]|nr:hypothetical protein [Dethiobacter sp.]
MAAVVVKKEEKVAAVFAAMSDLDDVLEFKAKFKEMFPKEWQHINSVYQKEERADTKHKGHPMPEPEKYLENMYKVARSKH